MVQERFGKSILELGGNNAILVDETANVDILMNELYNGLFVANGQCCTSTRRLASYIYLFIYLFVCLFICLLFVCLFISDSTR